MPRKEIVKIILGPNMLNGWLLLLAHLEPQRIERILFHVSSYASGSPRVCGPTFHGTDAENDDTKLGREIA
jgi:hypothetical protein